MSRHGALSSHPGRAQTTNLLDQFKEPYRTMVIVAQCTGLRVSEILALKWQDINFEVLTMRVTRKVVKKSEAGQLEVLSGTIIAQIPESDPANLVCLIAVFLI